MDDLEQTLANIYGALDLAQKAEDDILKSMAMMAYAGNMTIMPGSHMFGSKPVLMLPEAMYKRLVELYGAK